MEWEQIEVHVKQGKLPLGVAQGEGGGGASKTIASDSASARLAASIQYVQHDSNGSDDDDDEERVLMAGGSLMPMNIAGGRDRGPPSWAHTPDLGVMRSVSAAVAWMHAMAASLVYAIDWHPATDWWLQTFPSTMAFLYSTRLFRACVPVDPTRARAAAPRLVEAVLMALAMLSLMLVAAHVDL